MLRELAGIVREGRDRVDRLPLVEAHGLVDRAAEDAALVHEAVVQLVLPAGDAVVPEAGDEHELLLDEGVHRLHGGPHHLGEPEHPSGAATGIRVHLRQRAEVSQAGGAGLVEGGTASGIEIDHPDARLIRARDVGDVGVDLRDGRGDARLGVRLGKDDARSRVGRAVEDDGTLRGAGVPVRVGSVADRTSMDVGGVGRSDECVCHFGLPSAPLGACW